MKEFINRWKWQVLIMILMLMMLALFNHCVPEGGKKSSLKYSDSTSSVSVNSPLPSGANPGASGQATQGGGMGLSSVQAFTQTVHPLTRQRCVACHGSTQSPRHAVADAQMAHDAVINAARVDFNNPPNSRMVLKLREGHNCWSNCNSNADEMLAEVNEWKLLMQAPAAAAGTGSGASSGPSIAGLHTEESETISQVLDPNNVGNAGDVIIDYAAASLTAPMVKAKENNLDHVWVPTGTHNAALAFNDATAGRAIMTAAIPLARTYRIFGLARGLSTADDSFHVIIGNQRAEWHLGGDTGGYKWIAVTNGSARNPFTFNLAAQNYNIEVREREDGAKLSKLLITDDLNLQASDLQGGGPVATMSFPLNDISPNSNATFLIDVSIYDMYSYKLSNPRVRLTNGTMRVKNIKVLVNGAWNPQHSTYTIVDRVVTPQSGGLSNSELIVLKDQGEVIDQLTFVFELLTYTP